MAAHVTITRAGEHVPTADQRIVTYGVPWEFYEAQLALRGDRSAPRIAYLEGVMELMSPSKDHERIKSYIGRLIEAYALERGSTFPPTVAGRSRKLRRKAAWSRTSATSSAIRAGILRISPSR
jgi:hypothetical protein